jgi:hypothetical protein
VLGSQRQSDGLYYSQSSDGGGTWSQPEAVSEHAIQWSDIVCSGQQTVHRVWQEENESYFINLDQVSNDGGLTWKDPVYITSLSDKVTLGTLTSTRDGELFFIQMIDDSGPVMKAWRWNNTSWEPLESKDLFLGAKSIASSVIAGVTQNGSLGVLISVENQDPKAEVKNELIGLSRAVDLAKPSQSTGQIKIPTPKAVAPASDLSNPSPTSVSTPSLASLGDSTPKILNKNILGGLMIGGVLIFLFIFLLPRGKKVNDKNK